MITYIPAIEKLEEYNLYSYISYRQRWIWLSVFKPYLSITKNVFYIIMQAENYTAAYSPKSGLSTYIDLDSLYVQ